MPFVRIPGPAPLGMPMTPSRVTLNLNFVPPHQREDVREEFERGDGLRLVYAVDRRNQFPLVVLNTAALLARGIYEDALLAVLQNGEGLRPGELRLLKDLVRGADRAKLRASRLATPIPPGESFTLYRGVAGTGRQRQVRGLYWTSDATRAAQYAKQAAYLFPDPAVYVASVSAADICACQADNEFIVLLPAHVRPRRVHGLRVC